MKHHVLVIQFALAIIAMSATPIVVAQDPSVGGEWYPNTTDGSPCPR
ncbi:MAG: hypothetical protein CHACPFDD_01346 [Phycisphaerae bacterium]|nr:hypothetical protein [Phycisphaerae bacterium]